ncbi:MAG: PINc/VapC family ATPase, partial [Methanobacteriaceae archaeon]
MKYFYDDDLDTNLRIVPDTSVIIDGKITKILKEEGIKGAEIIIHEAVLFELENQANNGFKTGFNGLNELKALQALAGDSATNITISFGGRKPTRQEIFHAKSGDIDSLIRDLAYDEDAKLITSDIVQKELAQAKGIDVLYIKSDVFGIDNLEFMNFFDDTTMSIHLKEDVVPQAKKGTPGSMNLVDLDSKILTKPYLQKLARQIIKFSKGDDKSFLEIDMEGSKIIQLREYRISIAETPFSEAMEITVVRPVANVDFEDYNLSDKLLDRLKNSAKGVLISGAPGAGKSTFAQAVANYLSNELKCIVKTMESPRDLQVDNQITQYSPLEKDMQNTADVLLLVRPDYTIYDEVRKTHDFEIFADMRLAGVGMLGVVHATKPIDAIQRIVSRVDLGVIPSVVDTTIFIDEGEIKAVYDISFTVKVPTGMIEADLSRPVVEITDFATCELKHEIYTYGEQTIVMDVEIANAPSKSAKGDNKTNKSSVQKIAEK